MNTNDITGAIRDAIEDSAVTYTLGFYIERDSLDGKFHPLRVQVNRKDVTVRYAKGYFASPETAPSNDQNIRNTMTALQARSNRPRFRSRSGWPGKVRRQIP